MQISFVIKTAETHRYYTATKMFKSNELIFSKEFKDAYRFNSIDEVEACWEDDCLYTEGTLIVETILEG